MVVNQILKEMIDTIQERIYELYSPILRIVDTIFVRLDEFLTAFKIEKAREKAWDEAINLVNAKTDDERNRIKIRLNDDTAIHARVVAQPPNVPGWVMDGLSFLEKQVGDLLKLIDPL